MALVVCDMDECENFGSQWCTHGVAHEKNSHCNEVCAFHDWVRCREGGYVGRMKICNAKYLELDCILWCHHAQKHKETPNCSCECMHGCMCIDYKNENENERSDLDY